MAFFQQAPQPRDRDAERDADAHSLTTTSSTSSLSTLALSPDSHPFFQPSATSPALVRTSLAGFPYPQLERRSFRDASLEGELSSNPFAPNSTAPSSNNPTPGPGARARTVPTVGTIGDGRKSSTSSDKPADLALATAPSGVFDGRGPLLPSPSADSLPSSRPSSFILDLLPGRSSPVPSPSPTTKDLAGQQQQAQSSLLFQGPSSITTSRSPSPVPTPSACPVELGDSTRIARLEATVAELSSFVHHELRTLKDQVALLRSSSSSTTTTSSGQPLIVPNYSLPLPPPNRTGTESPLLTLRSPSPNSSPVFPVRTLQHHASLSRLSSSASSSYSEAATALGISASDSDYPRDPKDDQLRALTAQVNHLSATLAHVVSTSNSGISASPSPSPLLSQHPHLHSHRQLSLPLGGAGGASNLSPNGPGSPSLGVLGEWKAPLPQQVGSPGLGVGAAPRSPLLRPLSANGLSRQSSAGSAFGRSPILSGGGREAGDRFGPVGQNALRPEGAFETSSGAGWEQGSGMPSPLAGLVGSAINGTNLPGSLGGKWETLGIGNDLFRTIANYGLGPPTKIQCKAIPCVLRNQDIVSQAPSIQERIQAYVVPALQIVLSGLAQAALDGASGTGKGVQILIVTATVDQAAQAQRLSVGLGGSLGIRTALCVGQGDLQQDLHTFLKAPPHVLVGTPQRLLDLFAARQLPTTELRLLVIDECDQLIARNLADFVASLVKLLPPSGTGNAAPLTASPTNVRSPLPGAFDTPRFTDSPRFGSSNPILGSGSLSLSGNTSERQTVIFSCTVPQDVLNFASSLHLREPVRVLVRREGGDSSSPSVRGVKAYYLYIAVGSVVGSGGATKSKAVSGVGAASTARDAREWKLEALADLCEDYAFENCVIFCSSVDAVEAVSYKLGTRGIEALALHQDMGQAARHAIMSKFRAAPGNRSGPNKRALVVYDALCRTLTDVSQVPLCINYDLPRAVEDYIHRIACVTASGYGRPNGVVINFVTPGGDVDRLRAIESFYRVKISELPNPVTAA